MNGVQAKFQKGKKARKANSRRAGTASGTVTAANVVGQDIQGITPGADFAKVGQAMREGAAYLNVHTTRSKAGEICGPVRAGEGDDQ